MGQIITEDLLHSHGMENYISDSSTIYILLNSEIREACSLLLQEMPFGIKQVLPLKGK